MAMTMSRDKTNERNFEAQIWVKLAKNGAETWLFAKLKLTPKLKFSPFAQVCISKRPVKGVCFIYYIT